MTVDFASATCLIALVGTGASVYAVRTARWGRARDERVLRQGASPVLTLLFEGGYWCLAPIGRFLAAHRVSPNGLSWTSLLLAGAAGVWLAVGRFGLAAVAAAVSACLDALDGMVARTNGVASDAGEILDSAIDRYGEFLIMGGLVVYFRDVVAAQAVALLAVSGSFMVSYSTAKAEAYRVELPFSMMRRPERAICIVTGAALTALIGDPWRLGELPRITHPMLGALALVAVLANLSALSRLRALARTVRDAETSSWMRSPRDRP